MVDFTFKFANADFITEYLAIGGDLGYDSERAATQAAELVDRAHLTHILDVRSEAVEPLWGRFPGVEYLWDGIDDAVQEVPPEWFERITDWSHEAIAGGGAVLAHCHMGVNRGPSAGFAVLMREGWDPIDAIDAIRSARPQAFTAYAEDALEWHLGRVDASPRETVLQRGRLEQWRRDHRMDVARAIRLGGRRGGGWVA